jgi:hypothetical protein
MIQLQLLLAFIWCWAWLFKSRLANMIQQWKKPQVLPWSSTLMDEPSKKGCCKHPWFQQIPLIHVSTSSFVSIQY